MSVKSPGSVSRGVWLGAHIGISDGFDRAPVIGREIGCEAIQIFSKSPQMWKGVPIPVEAAERFRRAVVEQGLKATAVHHGYLLNLANPKDGPRKQSLLTLVDELQRAGLLGVNDLIIHPGAHLGSGVEPGIDLIAQGLNAALNEVPDGRVRILLENAAGQGTTIGSTFAELRSILDKVEQRARVGVTLDTCHLFAAGIDIRGPEAYGAMIDQLEADLGVAEVHAFHLNDAQGELGSHLDRHENIGQGSIGLEGFGPFVRDARWANVPGYLETPLDDRGYSRYEKDLRQLRSTLAPVLRARPKSRSPRPRSVRATMAK